MECLECKKIFNNCMGLSAHLRRTHKMKLSIYIEKFNLGRRCKVCNILLSKYNKFDCCNHHYDRHKIGLGMLGKKQTSSSKEKMSISQQELWKDTNFRNTHIQSQETKDKRAVSIKNAHIKDPMLSVRQTIKIRRRGIKIKGLTNIQIYGKEKAEKIKNKQKSCVRPKQSEQTKIKRGIYIKGRITTDITKKKSSNTRIKRILSGEIKISPLVGVGKGGYKNDIGHYVRSNYEYYFAKLLKNFGIKYMYEPKTFEVYVNKKKTSYTPDFLLIDSNKYIEIKNAFNVNNDVFQKKIKSFKEIYTNEKLSIIVGNKKWNPSIVMKNQEDLVEIMVELSPLAVIKG